MELSEAADDGNLSKVKELIDAGADIEEEGRYLKRTPLHNGALGGHIDIVDYLIKNGADVRSKDEKGDSPLHLASWAGRLEVVKLLIKGSDITSRTNHGTTALHEACSEGHPAVVDYLLQHGADVESRDEDGYSPFYRACLHNDFHVVQCLVNKGCDITFTAEDGTSGLDIAEFYGENCDLAKYVRTKLQERQDGITSNKSILVRDLDSKTRDLICQKLNIKTLWNKDFRGLAAEMMYETEEIEEFEQSDNPTKHLLDDWQFGKESTVENLKKLLQKIKRNDVIDILEEISVDDDDSVAEESTELSNVRIIEAAAEEAEKFGIKRNNRISVFLIGQDRVGKTSLKKNLLGETFQGKMSSTIGFEVSVAEVNEDNKSNDWTYSRDQELWSSKELFDRAVGETVALELELQKSNQREDEAVYESKDDKSGKTGEQISAKFQDEKKLGSQDDDDHKIEGNNQAKDTYATGFDQNQDGKARFEIPAKTKNTRAVDPELMRAIKKAMKDVDSLTDEIDTIRFMMHDVAGQSLFYDVHSIVLREESLFILVVGLDKALDAEAEPQFVNEETGEKVSLANYLVETNLDYANKWMTTLSMLNQRDGPAKAGDEHPGVILVLTKPDEIEGSDKERGDKIKEAKERILKSFAKLGCRKYIRRIFVINNKSKTSNIQDLRKCIFDIAKKKLENQEEIPINWLRFEHGLARAAADTPLINLQDAIEIGEEAEVTEKVAEAIEFLHQQNILIHFSEDPDAGELVVLDTRWLVKLFTKVITIPPCEEQDNNLAELWSKMKDTGVLCSTLLEGVLEDHGGNSKALTSIMERVSLICPSRDNTWLVPSMVQRKMESKDIAEELKKAEGPSLYIDFKCGYIPLGFFTRFLVEFLHWCQEVCCANPDLFCNFSRLPIESSGIRYYIILVPYISRIEIALTSTSENLSFSETVLAKIASDVKSFLLNVMKKLQRATPMYKGMEYRLVVSCGKRCNEIKECFRHQKKDCRSGNCICLVFLDKLEIGKATCATCCWVDDKLYDCCWLDRREKVRLNETTEGASEASTSSNVVRSGSANVTETKSVSQREQQMPIEQDLVDRGDASSSDKAESSKSAESSSRKRLNPDGKSRDEEEKKVRLNETAVEGSEPNTTSKVVESGSENVPDPNGSSTDESRRDNRNTDGAMSSAESSSRKRLNPDDKPRDKKRKPNMSLNFDEPLVKDIPYLTRVDICKGLNLESIVGQGDYRTLAGLMDMTTSDVKRISKSKDPTDELLSWWQTRISIATVAKLRELLLHPEMNREDLVNILDSSASTDNPPAVNLL